MKQTQQQFISGGGDDFIESLIQLCWSGVQHDKSKNIKSVQELKREIKRRRRKRKLEQHRALNTSKNGERKMPTSVNKTRPIKRKRRTEGEILEIRSAICDVVEEFKPMTVRQVFYQMVSRNVIKKTESEYKNTVCRILTEMRREAELPYDWIADSTRWMRKPETYSSLEGMLESQQSFYRRAVWDNQNAYVEIWLEKEALAGVLSDVTDRWDVPLMVTRGYPSLSFLHSAAEKIMHEEKPTFLYYFGDHDPSGVDIPRFVEEEIRNIAGNQIDMKFKRVAVLPEQIEEYGLQTRPTKKKDSRSKKFAGESVEVDAISPGMLRELCEVQIKRHINQRSFDQMIAVENAEKEVLSCVLKELA